MVGRAPKPRHGSPNARSNAPGAPLARTLSAGALSLQRLKRSGRARERFLLVSASSQLDDERHVGWGRGLAWPDSTAADGPGWRVRLLPLCAAAGRLETLHGLDRDPSAVITARGPAPTSGGAGPTLTISVGAGCRTTASRSFLLEGQLPPSRSPLTRCESASRRPWR